MRPSARTTAPSPADFSTSKTGLSLKTEQPRDPVRSPRSTLKNGFPFDADFAASFFTTSRLANDRPLAPSSALSSRTVISGKVSSAMGLHKLGVGLEERMFHVAE